MIKDGNYHEKTTTAATNTHARLVVFQALYQLVCMGICLCLEAMGLLGVGGRSLVGLLILLT